MEYLISTFKQELQWFGIRWIVGLQTGRLNSFDGKYACALVQLNMVIPEWAISLRLKQKYHGIRTFSVSYRSVEGRAKQMLKLEPIERVLGFGDVPESLRVMFCVEPFVDGNYCPNDELTAEQWQVFWEQKNAMLTLVTDSLFLS